MSIELFINSNLDSDSFFSSSAIFSATLLLLSPEFKHFDQSITFCKISKFSNSSNSAPAFTLSCSMFQAPRLASFRLTETSSPLPGIPSTKILFTTPVFPSKLDILLSTASQYFCISSCKSFEASGGAWRRTQTNAFLLPIISLESGLFIFPISSLILFPL